MEERLGRGGVGLKFKCPAIGVHQRVPLAALDLLAAILAQDASALARPDALAVDHDRCRTFGRAGRYRASAAMRFRREAHSRWR